MEVRLLYNYLCGILMGSMVIFIIMTSKIVKCEEDNGELLRVGFYEQTCPLAERIVRQAVVKGVASNPGMAAGIIRLHFHDCIVLGCDASILLDKTSEIQDFERDRAGNPLLRGFEIIDNAKSTLESHCPKTVSCADILAFAARDSVAAVGHFTYPVPAGRRDSLLSHGPNVTDNLPFPTTDIGFLAKHFHDRGLSLRDMVALSAAHSIGRTACAEFSDRIFFFDGVDQNSTDPSLDPEFAGFLKDRCPLGSGFDKTVDLDNVTANLLDVQYFVNLKRNRGVLSSDQALETHALTAARVRRYRDNRAVWMRDFAAAMVKMGKLLVLTGDQGEIRTNCHFRN